MTHWISCKTQLPDFGQSIIGVVKIDCECEHYGLCIFRRIEGGPENVEWSWYIDGTSHCIRAEDVIYWALPPMLPAGLKYNDYGNVHGVKH
jgi:hypothetical protein